MYSPIEGFAGPFMGIFYMVGYVVSLVVLVIQGLALWSAAKNNQAPWFVAILIVPFVLHNLLITAAVLVAYLGFFRADRHTRPITSLVDVSKMMPKKAAPQPSAKNDTKEDDLPVAETSPVE